MQLLDHQVTVELWTTVGEDTVTMGRKAFNADSRMGKLLDWCEDTYTSFKAAPHGGFDGDHCVYETDSEPENEPGKESEPQNNHDNGGNDGDGDDGTDAHPTTEASVAECRGVEVAAKETGHLTR